MNPTSAPGRRGSRMLARLLTILACAVYTSACVELPTGEADPVQQGGVRELAPNSAVSNLAGAGGSRTVFRVTVPSGVGSIEIRTSGGHGDVDLVVERGSVQECSSRGSTTAEVCVVSNPTAGIWNVALVGYSAYGGVTLSVVLGGAGGGGGSGGGSGGGGGSTPTDVYSRHIFWHYSAKKLTVTIDGVSLGPFIGYHQPSGPIYPANRCAKTQEPSSLTYQKIFGQNYAVLAGFRTLPGVRYSYTAVFDDGTTRTGTITGYNAGYCGTQQIRY